MEHKFACPQLLMRYQWISNDGDNITSLKNSQGKLFGWQMRSKNSEQHQPSRAHRMPYQVLRQRERTLYGQSRTLSPMPIVSWEDRKSTRLNSSHVSISYAVF